MTSLMGEIPKIHVCMSVGVPLCVCMCVCYSFETLKIYIYLFILILFIRIGYVNWSKIAYIYLIIFANCFVSVLLYII